jgi:hypothetical protein
VCVWGGGATGLRVSGLGCCCVLVVACAAIHCTFQGFCVGGSIADALTACGRLSCVAMRGALCRCVGLQPNMCFMGMCGVEVKRKGGGGDSRQGDDVTQSLPT